MAKIPKGKKVVCCGKTYRDEIPDHLLKYLPEGFGKKPKPKNTSTSNNENETKK